MINQECAICKLKSRQLTKDSFLSRNEFAFPINLSARYLDMLWNFNLQTCPMCFYTAKDIGICDQETKNIVSSDTYKEILLSFEALPISDFNDVAVYQYALHGHICEAKQDYFNASTSHFKTADQLHAMSYEWRHNQIHANKPALLSEEQKKFDYLVGLSKHYLAKSLELINLCEESIDVLIFKAFILSAQEENEKSEAVLTEVLANYVLSPEQRGAVLIIQRDNKKVFKKN